MVSSSPAQNTWDTVLKKKSKLKLQLSTLRLIPRKFIFTNSWLGKKCWQVKITHCYLAGKRPSLPSFTLEAGLGTSQHSTSHWGHPAGQHPNPCLARLAFTPAPPPSPYCHQSLARRLLQSAQMRQLFRVKSKLLPTGILPCTVSPRPCSSTLDFSQPPTPPEVFDPPVPSPSRP